MRNPEFQAKKKARLKTNQKNLIPEEYHNFLDIFCKKNSDTLFFYQKYDHKIILEEKQKHGYTPLYKISSHKLNAL